MSEEDTETQGKNPENNATQHIITTDHRNTKPNEAGEWTSTRSADDKPRV